MTFDPDSTAVFQANLDLSGMPRVLLVDDDELILERLRALVDAAGFEVEAVRDAKAALDCLKHNFSPIVIMDRRMPGMDGLELCKAVRQQNWPGYVYILLLTAQDSEEDILAGLMPVPTIISARKPHLHNCWPGCGPRGASCLSSIRSAMPSTRSAGCP